MQQREVYLREQMTKLLQEVEENSMQRSRFPALPRLRFPALPRLHFPALPRWTIWALGALLLFLLFRLILQWYSDRKERIMLQRVCEMWRNIDREHSEVVHYGDPNDVTYRSRFYMQFSIWPLKTRRDTCKMLEDLMDELVGTCQTVPQRYFTPRLQPVIGVGVGFEGNSPVYRMLVPLKAPPGHVFHLELGPDERKVVRNSCLRVELQCTCTREWLLEDMLCFLHHPEDELRRKQMPSLLETLCTDSYLDIAKTAAWLQELVEEAWADMPQAATMDLELLPSVRFCKFKLITASSKVLSIELMLGVQQEDADTDTFVTFE
ncbi:inositol 1,4,5-trisphosphate receptor-interacting protein-like 1 [Numida meleagris]|uniref:inositol 1,4,5-trisphosphate receptor-interacting protein-like 1 n=1 Tax=Numida meleagris TaxID=8996 RepID=UPI000B3DE022|nr:inositol 1,4,5-trisphosphate receptor-interacting protein-like 1 [Numida meleagris]XP_021259382.1 inositol 1,4,5-trisphosphate receptor-interacting protein-like 1 [Numida meleagris]XP_021259384.1 inositol 1,4,5-trisphosphate receptor-interacting protein-like 1 [Numida meleagris]